MKSFLKKYSKWGLMACLLLVVLGFVAMAGHGPEAAALGMLPFAIGAIKVRDDMTVVRTVKYTHSGATVTDTIYLLNSLPMLAMNSALANVSNIFVIAGLIEYAKVSAQAWTGGVKLYWDNSLGQFTTASSGNTLAGFAAEAAANPSATGFIILMPQLVGTNALENLIADPGNAGAIPVTASGVVALTTAGVETRTLADPTVIGQQLVIIHAVDGGSAAITAASAVNQAGNTIMTQTEVNDSVMLTAVKIGSALKWRITANDGTVLS